MAKLSNEKWRDDKALAQINEASADKRLAKVFEKAHQESSTDPLGYVHSAVENRMERWDRVSLGRFFRKARSEYETTDAHMARIPERSPKHAIAVPPTHTPEDYARRKSFYQDHYDTLQHKELAKRLLVEDQKPAWQLRLERQLGQASLQEDTVQATLEQSIETRFTRDSAEAQLRSAEKWVARPLGPRPDAPWRVVACVSDVGMGFGGAANLAGALEDLAEVSALCVPGRLHRGDEIIDDGPTPDYGNDAPPPDDDATLRRVSVLTNEAQHEPSELRRWGREAREALHALGFFEDRRPWILYGHGVGAVLAHQLVLREIQVNDPYAPTLPKHLFVSGCCPPSQFDGPPGPLPCDHPPEDSSAPPPPPLGLRDDIALLFYACRLRSGRDPKEQPPLSDDDRDEQKPPRSLPMGEVFKWPEVQRQRRRRALNQYRLQDLPAPLRESAALRRVAAKGIRRDYRLLEAHVHEADWPLKLPITALAGEHDLSLTDKDLQGWSQETKRAFSWRRVQGGTSYIREPAGLQALADLLRGACEQTQADDAESSDDERRKRAPPSPPGPWSLADYYPESPRPEEEEVPEEGFEATLAAMASARKKMQLRYFM